ncbi:MAG: ATP-binding protein, partial [Chitinophagales bacterium]
CGNKKPKLIYVKVSEAREEKLKHLLQDIQDSDTACYQKFSNAKELKTLLENDLSVLMSETFENALFENLARKNEDILQQIQKKAEKRIELPNIKSQIIGRDADIKNIAELLGKPSVSVVNILGTGGTGKTTLSIHIAHRLKEDFRDGVLFISLAPVTDSKLVAGTIASVLELQDNGKVSIEQTLTDYLSDKSMLLVLDNFEQIVDASHVVSDIMNKCPEVKIIVTSRATLHIRGENVYHLSPLEIPGEERAHTEEQFIHFPAVELFITRAREVNQNLQLTDENKSAIATICNKLDGLPLAIELAASRTKLFQPAVLLKRMDKLLDLTSKGQRDLPERQQTLRNAIEWSYNLLDEDSKKVFRMLGAFKRSWTLEAADAVMNSGAEKFIDIEDITEKLLDVSLIKPVLVAHSDEPRFNMLQTVHEFANEILNKSEELTKTELQYAYYYLDFFSATEDLLFGTHGEPWLDKMEYEFQNIRAAYYIFLKNNLYEQAWKLFYLLVPFWGIRGGFSEALIWIKEAGIDDFDNAELLEKITDKQKGQTQTWAAFVTLMMLQIERGYALLYSAEKYAEEIGDEVSLCFALAMDGCYGAFMQYPDAREKIEKAKELGLKTNHPLALCFYYTWSYQYYLELQQYEIIAQNKEWARQIAEQNNFNYILGSLYLIHYSMMIMQGDIDYQEVYESSIRLYDSLPEKGYKGLKAAAMGGLAYAMLKMGQKDEVWPILKKALQYTRESGEKESEFYGVMEAAQYYSLSDFPEKACKLMGSVDAFVQTTSYPLVGPASVQYNQAKMDVFGEGDIAGDKKRWYEEGKKMRLEDAVVYAMKKDA